MRIAKSTLVTKGISFTTQASSDRSTRVVIGTESVPVTSGDGLASADLKALKAATASSLGTELVAAGYPKTAHPAQANMTLLIVILLLFVVASTALYGPQAAALVEMFPTRNPLHGYVLPPRRDGLGRRIPARDQLCDRGDHREHIRRALVFGHLHRDFGGRLAAVPQGDRRTATSRNLGPRRSLWADQTLPTAIIAPSSRELMRASRASLRTGRPASPVMSRSPLTGQRGEVQDAREERSPR